ncbi:stressosome-associated protein Prli42 [Chengkuizengella axinellae]|uniref:Stressosome-associated protein Prli42 n=1 Tax=Chengkuizengella axinellae TaxID=3064388 RepID=A0ABT9IWD6_9BACL|nr:stressosome-associated protein Prli42 [Chengkuizengella sp. 2205SS18-9]MDP5273627.1 stressosome-associated protein Prli42 [Chengkuizengella sp. 2205SS18-9]
MGKNKLWFKIIIYIMIGSMLLSTILFSISFLAI